MTILARTTFKEELDEFDFKLYEACLRAEQRFWQKEKVNASLK